MIAEHLEFQVQGLLGVVQDADGSFRLMKLIVDGNEGLHTLFRVDSELQLLVVKCLGICMTLLCQCSQSSARGYTSLHTQSSLFNG